MASTPFEKRANHLSRSTSRRKRRCHIKQTFSSPSLYSFKKCGENFSHGIPVDEILATLYFLLCASSETGGESLPACYYLMAGVIVGL